MRGLSNSRLRCDSVSMAFNRGQSQGLAVCAVRVLHGAMTDAEITPSFDENQPQGAPAPSDTPLHDQPSAAGEVGGARATDQEPQLPAPGASSGDASSGDVLENEALHNEEQP